MANKYELMAARIEDVCRAQKVPARVWQATVTTRFVRFDMTVPLGFRIAKITDLTEELAFSLGAPAVTVYRAAGVLHVEVPREGPAIAYTLPVAFGKIRRFPSFSALLGECSDSQPLLVKLDSPDVAHLLIAGTTGSGKTALLRALLLTLAMTNWPGNLQLVLVDPKGDKLAPLAAFPHMWRGLPVITDPSDAGLVLRALVAEMERRNRALTSLPRVVVAIDELADLIATGGSVITDALERLTQAGRERGLHVVAATQRPSATLVGGMVKANFPVRLVGSVASTDDAKVAAGIGGTGAERLTGKGDFFLIAKGQQLRFQALWVGNSEIGSIAAAMGQSGRRGRAWSQPALEEVLRNPPALPAQSRAARSVAEAVSDLVTVTSDRADRAAKPLPVTNLSRGAVTDTGDSHRPTLSDEGQTPAQLLDRLLPPGQFLPMTPPRDYETQLIMVLANRAMGGRFNAMCGRLFGFDERGRVRKKGPVADWLAAAQAAVRERTENEQEDSA